MVSKRKVALFVVPVIMLLLDVVLTWEHIELERNIVPSFFISTFGRTYGFAVWAVTYLGVWISVLVIFVIRPRFCLSPGGWVVSLFYGIVVGSLASAVATHYLAFLNSPWLVQFLWPTIVAVVSSVMTLLHRLWVEELQLRK